MTLLTTPMFQILGALSGSSLHGYAISKKIVSMLGDRSKAIGPATLYTTLQKLLEQKLVEEVGELAGDPRRKTYRLTQSGLGALAQEMARQRAFLEAIAPHDATRSAI